ncbi:hypothetical protein QUA82_07910 [Microcoleus sp. F8-D3]
MIICYWAVGSWQESSWHLAGKQLAFGRKAVGIWQESSWHLAVTTNH